MATTCVFDIEANGLADATKVWCISIYDLASKKLTTFRPEDIKKGIEKLCSYDVLIGHNIIGYDIPTLKRLHPEFDYPTKLLDTYTLSQLLDNDRPNALGSNKPHSLEAWGIRFGFPKVEQEQWEVWEENMIPRCEGDVKITTMLYHHFMEEISEWKKRGENWWNSIRLEMKVAKIVADQEKNGWQFDVEYANKIVKQIDRQKELLEELLAKSPWPYSVDFLGEYVPWKNGKYDELVSTFFKPKDIKQFYFSPDHKKPTRQELIDGPFSLYVDKYLGEEVNNWVEITCPFQSPEANSRFEKIFIENNQTPAGRFSLVNLNVFNYTSVNQIRDYMLSLGWEPKQSTEKGTPQISDGEMEKVLGKRGMYLQMYQDISKVRSKISNPDDDDRGLLAFVRPDGRIPAVCNPQGTPTGRARHAIVANLGKVNVDKETGNFLFFPQGKVCYGTEQRMMFTVAEGCKLVGCDASGLELRMLAHYMDDDNFTKELLTGDIHTYNQKAAGLPTRDDAKTFIYGFIYGAGNEKIGSIVNGSSKRGKELKEKFLASLPKLETLMNRVKSKAETMGYLVGLDGRVLKVREGKEHAGLNLLLQSAGAVVMKVAMVLMHKYFEKAGISEHCKQVGWFHDEIQCEVKEEYAELAGQLMRQSMIDAGKILKLRCPLDAEYKAGGTWAHTH